MRNWMKQLGTGLGFAFTLGVSATALAYPPQCMDTCSCSSLCTQPCYEGTHRTTCADEICGGCMASDPQASLTQQPQTTQEAQKQHDASQDVCSDSSEAPVSSKS